MQHVVQLLDQLISTEERINDMVAIRNTDNEVPSKSKNLPWKSSRGDECMFCASQHHKSSICTQYATIPERRNIMLERKLCLNCGKPGHFLKECTSQGCRTCQGKRHHHTLCPQRTQGQKSFNVAPAQPTKKAPPKGPLPKSPTKSYGMHQRAREQPKREDTHVNPIQITSIGDTTAQDDEPVVPQEAVVMQSAGSKEAHRESVSLLTGSAKSMEDQNTQRLQADYDALLRALPPLPEPEDLYARIIRTCRQFWVSSKSVDNLGLWIRSMRTSQDSRQERYALYRLLVETVNRVRLELYLVRSQLATLWALPSLLIATHKVEPEVWRMMINRQQEDDDGKPLLVNNKQLEQAILDKLGILEDQCANLREYGDTLRQEDLQEDRHFRAQVLAELESLRCLISNFITHSAASESAEHRVDDDTDRMGAMKQQIYNQVDESEVIRNNEQFMEQLNEFDEEPPMENDLVMIDEEAQMDNESDTEVSNEEQDLHNEGDAEVRNGERGFDNQSDAEAGNGEQGSDNQSDAEGGNEEQGFDYERDAEIRNEEQGNGPDGEEGEIRNDAQDVGPRRPVQQVRDEIADLRQQLRQARQAMLDFRMMINELENRERCETRKFDGIIQNPNERFMPCAFCGRRGDHYSDSCLVYRFTGERKERVNLAHLCTMCLDYDCPGGRRCLKRNTRCYHCGRSGHNSALCTLPEKSVRINDELELLQRRYSDALGCVLRLERKLRRRGVDV
ncbi:zinc knuckle [Ostertagia ostertagi]